MRALKTTDVFAAMRIITAAGIADEMRMIATAMDDKEANGETLGILDIGVTFCVGFLEKIVQGPSEKAFYKFISGPLEISEKDIADMDPLDLIDKIKELEEVIDVERWKNFFKRVADFLPKIM